MKKIILASAVVCSFLFAQKASAQLFDQRRNLSIGVNGGVNLSSVDFNPKIQQNTLNGMSYGVTARYMSEKYFKMMCGIQAEINYSQRGWKEKIDDGSGDTYSRRMNYVEMPLMAHLAFGKDALDKGLKFFINLGPSVSFLLNETEEKSEQWNTANRPNGVIEQYGKMADKKFDYGLLGGAGLELSTKIGYFLLEGRYYFGLADFYNNTKKDYFSRSANTYYGARLTYLFDITK